MIDRLLTFAGRVETELRRPAALLLLLLALGVYGAVRVRGSMGDFQVYRRAAGRALERESVHRLTDRHRYLYAPVVTFAFFPLAVLPPLAGKILWFALNLVVVVAILDLSARLVFPDGRAPPGFKALVVLLGFRFIDNNLGHGQVNLILLWLVLAAYAAAARGRVGLAALALAASIATKIVPVVFLGQLLLRRQWRFAASTLVALVALMIAPWLWWGAQYPAILRDWVAVVHDQSGHYDIANKINQSIAAFVERLFRPYAAGAPLIELSPGFAAATTAFVHVAFVAPLVWLSLRLATNREEPVQGSGGSELALYLLYSTVAAPYSWKYYFANLLFPLAVCAAALWSEERRRFEAPLGVAFALNLLAGFRGFGKRIGLVFQLASFHFLSVVVLFVTIWRVAAARARSDSPAERDFSSSIPSC